MPKFVSASFIAGLALLAVLALRATIATAGPFDACKEHLPFGIPKLTHTANATPVCHKGYAALVDNDKLVPIWVAYRLTRQHSLGCLGRTNNFHEDAQLPPGHRAAPSDYEGSGYDQGHMAPADDFGWDIGVMKDSFSMANMAPQLPGLNRAEWERLEETVRAWAWARGELVVYVGAIVKPHGKTIGADHVAVPVAFWKVVVDPRTGEALAFNMPQRAIPRGSLSPWQVSARDIDHMAGLALPVISTNPTTALWRLDLTGWRSAKERKCR